MVGMDRVDGGPRSAIVVGAGVVGLSTAWFLQDRGVDVKVVDRDKVAAGASWGNAGWIAPSLTIPLNTPAVLRYAMRAMRDPLAPLHIPLRADVGLARFLMSFAGHCTPSAWLRAARANIPLNEDAIEAFDVLLANGVDVPVTDSPITAVFDSAAQADQMLAEFRHLEAAGQGVEVVELAGAELRAQVPLASTTVGAGLSVTGQRFVDPGRFVHGLADAVTSRGGATIAGTDVREVRSHGDHVTVHATGVPPIEADVAVVATGALLPELVGPRMRTSLRAGRGYSFTVPVDRPLPTPIYLPQVRVACTPYQGAMRVAGTMEFRRPDEPAFPQRVGAIVASAAQLLDGVRWDERSDVWVGSRPVTADGRPLIGETTRGVYVAGGHGMWGLAHGPVTGRLLAEQITTGKQPDALREFAPLR